MRKYSFSVYLIIPNAFLYNHISSFNIDLSSFREPNTLRTSHWDSLEKALTVFILPENHDANQRQKHIHRRVDLIFAAPEVYWTAVVGWLV